MTVHRNGATKTPKRRQPRRMAGPVHVVRVSAAALAAARIACEGRDVHAVTLPDGSILIANGARR